MADFEENKRIIERAKEALGIPIGHGSDKQLAEHLEVSVSVLSGWKTRNQVDYEKLRSKLTAEQFFYATTGQSSKKKSDPKPPVETWEGAISRETHEAIQRAVQMVDDYVLAIPEDLRSRIDKRQKGFVVAQLVDELVGGHLEQIPKILGNFLKEVRQSPAPTAKQ